MTDKTTYQRRIFSKNVISLRILEIVIMLVGIVMGVIVYDLTDQINETSNQVRGFDNQVTRMLTSITLAQVHFSELVNGNTTIDIQRDVFAYMDTADELCRVIDSGGPQGQFKPTPFSVEVDQPQVPLLCNNLSTLRSVIGMRWQAYQDQTPDYWVEGYQESYDQIIEMLNQYTNVTDPGMEKTQLLSRKTNVTISIGIALIFFVISFVIWLNRKTIDSKNKRLEDEIIQRTRLNSELDSERNLLNTLIDNIPDAVFANDTQKRYLVVNKATAQIMGVNPKEDMIGHTSSDFMVEETANRMLSSDDHVLLNGQALTIPQEEVFDRSTESTRWFNTTKVPLIDSEGRTYGLVGISHDITREKEVEEKLKQNLAALEQNSRDQERMSKMVDLLQACNNIQEAFIVIADQLNKFFPKDSGCLYLVNSSRNLMDRVAAWGEPFEDPLIFKPDDCWGMRRGRLHIVEENSANHLEIHHSLICQHVLHHEASADYLCLPLAAQGETLGLLHLRHISTSEEAAQKKEPWFGHEKRQRIRHIMDSLSLSLANLNLTETLRQQSIRDPLTNLFNRRYLEETLERELLRAGRNHENLGVMMLDIDHFKRFNDTYGHQAGDALLKTLGGFFTANIRGEDVACRYGGEEFLLLLPGSSLAAAEKRAEELRKKIHNLTVEFQEQTLPTVSLSFGIAVFPQHGSTAAQLIHNADQALYRAKAEGRDRVATAV
jgi:diguanylate cyclase (GGDEF)-like protein/PAS domain S-box-containing protein